MACHLFGTKPLSKPMLAHQTTVTRCLHSDDGITFPKHILSLNTSPYSHMCLHCRYQPLLIMMVWKELAALCQQWSPSWRHQMETFSALLALCAANSPVPGEFPAQRPVTRSFDVFFDLRPIKQLSKQSLRWWFEMPSGSLWRHCNDTAVLSEPGDDKEFDLIATSKSAWKMTFCFHLMPIFWVSLGKWLTAIIATKNKNKSAAYSSHISPCSPARQEQQMVIWCSARL